MEFIGIWKKLFIKAYSCSSFLSKFSPKLLLQNKNINYDEYVITVPVIRVKACHIRIPYLYLLSCIV